MILNTNQQMCKNECGFINTNTKSNLNKVLRFLKI